MSKKKDSKTEKRWKAIRQKVVRHMKNLGVYDANYGTSIDVYADLLLQYEILNKEWERQGFKVEEEYTNKAGATNMRKIPVVTAIEKLRVDLARYSDMLGLNPKSYESMKVEKEETSTLDKVLGEISKIGE